MAARPVHDSGIADVIGVGFGPANLALAIALAERPELPGDARVPRVHFFEKQPEFGWHRGMLLDGATMQVSFLKDLTTPRKPTSPFSFLSYLHTCGRLMDFINRKSFFPFRTEFHDYLSWAAAHFAEDVDYGCEVVGLRVACDTDHIDVVVRQHGALFMRPARNVVLATGLEPVLPEGVSTGERIWHSSQLLHMAEKISRRRPQRFVVVGAGQSAAEAVDYLHGRFPDAEVHAVFARYGFSVADNSAFANQVFEPAAVEHFFGAPDEVKEMLTRYHLNTNYSVVDVDLIQSLYDKAYREGITGNRRLYIRCASRVRSHDVDTDGVRVDIEFLPTGEVAIVDADAVVFATGYRTSDPAALLGEFGNLCHRDEQGLLRVGRDYRVLTEDSLTAGIYVQGPTEHTHGISSTLLSNIAVRAGEIVDSLMSRMPGPALKAVADPALNGHGRVLLCER